MAYQKCPVCNGSGLVRGGFYDPPMLTSCTAVETCRTCQGHGIIVDDIKTWQDSVIQKQG